jgi:hypothetical protein
MTHPLIACTDTMARQAPTYILVQHNYMGGSVGGLTPQIAFTYTLQLDLLRRTRGCRLEVSQCLV